MLLFSILFICLQKTMEDSETKKESKTIHFGILNG